MDLGVISFPWHDIYALKGPIMARSQLGTGHPSDPVTQRFSCEVFQVDIIPSFQTISSRDGLTLSKRLTRRDQNPRIFRGLK